MESSSDSSLTSPQEDSPIKMSPVSERIKALEALAAKKNEPESRSDGGFPHFRERHYEKPPMEVSPPAPFQKKIPPQEKESPESPFEVLGDNVSGTDFEDTADWMRAHLPPAPNFGTEDSDVDDGKIGVVPTTDHSLKGKKEETVLAAAVPEQFVGVPDAFMDTPIEPPDLKDDYNPEKQENLEEESEFDLNFLPTAYMWEKHEDNASKGSSGQPAVKESDVVAPPTTAPPPAGFGSPSPPLSPPPSPPVSPPRAKVPKTTPKGGEAEPSEAHEMDSSGDSDDTVIEDACAAAKANSAPLPAEKEPVPIKPPLQVPIINVIETEEQVVSEEEYEVEEEEEDERYRVMQDPVREPPREQEPISDVKKAGPTDTAIDEDSTSTNQPTQVFMTESADSHSKHPNNQDGGGVYGTAQTMSYSRALFRAESQDVAMVSETESNDRSDVTVGKDERSANIADYRDHPSNDQESGMDSFFNNNASQERSQKEKPKCELISEDDYMSDNISKSTALPNLNAGSLVDQSYKDHFGDDSLQGLDESSDDRQLNFDTVPEPSPSEYASDTCIETAVSQNIYNVGSDNSKAATNSGDLPLMADDNYTTLPEEEQPSMQEYPQDDFSYYNEQPEPFPDMMEDLESNQDAKDVTSGPSAGNAKGSESTEPLATDSFVEFMRECIQARQDEDPDPLRQIRTTDVESPKTGTATSPAAVMALEQESNTIRALKELGSSQEEEEDNKTSSKSKTSKQEKKSSQPQTHGTPSPTRDSSAGGVTSESSLSKEVEAIDILVAEAFYLAEHVLTAILTHLSGNTLLLWAPSLLTSHAKESPAVHLSPPKNLFPSWAMFPVS
ncbi:hypothetical protein ACEWY4_025069 [Coilia grayii]|uniref:Uncharacterized protein n=1 Tax=Coilia grayii TaxID=363190 RepID=A0ABD1IWI1_9TELE